MDTVLPELAVGLRKAELPVGLADEILGPDCHDIFRVFGHVEMPALAVESHYDVRQPGHQRTMSLLALPQRLLRPLALSDI